MNLYVILICMFLSLAVEFLMIIALLPFLQTAHFSAKHNVLFSYEIGLLNGYNYIVILL